MTLTHSQQIKLLIQAADKKEADTILHGLNIERLKTTNTIATGNSYIAEISLGNQLTDEEYKLIQDEAKIAILQDSDSKSRASKMMDKIYEVEMRLRTIVMYMPPEMVKLFHDIATRTQRNIVGQYATDAMTTSGLLDTIADQLTLSEMIQLFGTDLSIENGNIQGRTLGNIIDLSKDFDDFKNKLSDHLKHRLVWDVITPNVLDHQINWDKIRGDFKALEKGRNNAAHFHTITESEKEDFLHLADDILARTKLKQSVSKEDTVTIANQLSSFSTYFSSMPSLFNPTKISDIANIFQQQLNSIDFASLSEEANRLQEAIRQQGRLLMPYLSSFTPSSIQVSLNAMSLAASSIQSELNTLMLYNRINIDPYDLNASPTSNSSDENQNSKNKNTQKSISERTDDKSIKQKPNKIKSQSNKQ